MTPRALTDAPIDLTSLIDAVSDAEHGGIATFQGTTRREGGSRAFAAIEYEAYDTLAEAEIAAIAAEASARFGARVAVRHRIGTVRVGETSVAIAAGAPHRREAFDACRYVIDELKRRVPIWKRAHFEDGTSAWFDDVVPGADRPEPSGTAHA
jgi:molybdopterin synthase catalytic subunit